MSRWAMATASAPPVTPDPHCLDLSILLVIASLSASRIRRVMTLRSHSPTWLGLSGGADAGGMGGE